MARPKGLPASGRGRRSSRCCRTGRPDLGRRRARGAVPAEWGEAAAGAFHPWPDRDAQRDGRVRGARERPAGGRGHGTAERAEPAHREDRQQARGADHDRQPPERRAGVLGPADPAVEVPGEARSTRSATSRPSSATSTSRRTRSELAALRPGATRRSTWRRRRPTRASRCRSSSGRRLGYQDRDQYKILTLFEPGQGVDAAGRPQKQWNHKLLITHGGGCGGDYGAGGAPLDDYSGTLPPTPGCTQSYIAALGRGFAVMSTALDNNGHNCNIVVQAESLIMAKERLIERYGDVRYTIGTGCSGGSLVQQQVANAYPGGVYDGLVITCAYPDTLTAGAQFADYHLLRLYFEDPSRWGPGVVWTPAQWAAVEGTSRPRQRDRRRRGPVQGRDEPGAATACPRRAASTTRETNPGGVRCSILDYMINVLGPRPERVWTDVEQAAGRGFARRAVRQRRASSTASRRSSSGLITPAQFVDLNAKIGGLDIDVKHVARAPGGRRQRGSRTPTAAARSTRATTSTSVAIIDHAGPDPGIAHDYATPGGCATGSTARAGPPRQPRALVRAGAADRRPELGDRGAAGDGPLAGRDRGGPTRASRWRRRSSTTSPPTSRTAAIGPASSCRRSATSRSCRPATGRRAPSPAATATTTSTSAS